MNNQGKNNRWIKNLAFYYAVLQVVHMIFLMRVGFFLVSSGVMPFPASPPPGGWISQVIPFFIGMGIADAVAAGFGFYFVYLIHKQDSINITLGIVSLTTAFSSGFVFLVGTIASGAWNSHLAEYIILILVFIPLFILYWLLLGEVKTPDNSN